MSPGETRYTDINNGREYPPLTREAAGKAARALCRHFGSPADAAMRPALSWDHHSEARPARRSELARKLQQWTDSHVSGARRCWVATKPTRGHDKGWGRLIHDVSHMIHSYRHPKNRPHDPLHAAIEREVQVYAELNLIGVVCDTPPRAKPDPLQGLNERLARWIAKRKRAETAIRKLTRKVRAHTRRHAAKLDAETRSPVPL